MVATLTLLHDVTANAALLTLLAGPRWAIGPRDLALLGRRARELAGAAGAARPEFADVGDQLLGRRRGRRPDRDPVARATRSTTRATSTTPPRRASGSRCSPTSCAACARARRRAAPRPGAPDHRHHRHRRRAGVVGQPRGRGPARQPRPVRQGGGRVPGRRRRRSRWPRCWPTRGRGRVRAGPRRRDAVRGRLGQAADRPPRQGPRVGRGLPGRRLARRKFPTNRGRVELAHRRRR